MYNCQLSELGILIWFLKLTVLLILILIFNFLLVFFYLVVVVSTVSVVEFCTKIPGCLKGIMLVMKLYLWICTWHRLSGMLSISNQTKYNCISHAYNHPQYERICLYKKGKKNITYKDKRHKRQMAKMSLSWCCNIFTHFLNSIQPKMLCNIINLFIFFI